ncbi:type III pantothenate kinase [Hydrogenivirga caldilitoris]|uniref:Type III pantothenate kinase n=1 Tax=Hydrogenivirga caldilitoris TaxID=246264 RepID=A0A497XML5_9AQUI|nr:type III pantothenate kinase [Hydrogenivirga caldilitoris]RLJ70166.1 type III pantothenate kinase [Hydrogenivirga caldilitoris]
MKVLTLDVGNTTVDVCEFSEGSLNHLGRFGHDDIQKLRGYHDKVVALSVRPSVNRRLEETFGHKLKLLSLKDIPIEVDYETPETLGVDRVLFAYGVREFYSPDAVLVMAGTALVLDLLLEGTFKGGFITAGVRLKLSSLSERTEGIPPFEPEAIKLDIGRSTRDCVVGGVYRESRSFIEKTVEDWSIRFGKTFKVLITGGDGWLFEDLGVYDPLILHRAMVKIAGF